MKKSNTEWRKLSNLIPCATAMVSVLCSSNCKTVVLNSKGSAYFGGLFLGHAQGCSGVTHGSLPSGITLISEDNMRSWRSKPG